MEIVNQEPKTFPNLPVQGNESGKNAITGYKQRITPIARKNPNTAGERLPVHAESG